MIHNSNHSSVAGCTGDIRDPASRLERLKAGVVTMQHDILERTHRTHLMIVEMEECEKLIAKGVNRFT